MAPTLHPVVVSALLLAPLVAQEPKEAGDPARESAAEGQAATPAPSAPAAHGSADERVRAAVGFDLAVTRSKIRRSIVSTSTPYGFLVDEVDADTPAARAGIEPGWLLMKWGGRPVREVDELDGWLWELPAGAEIVVSCARKKEGEPIWSRDPWEDVEVTLVLTREHPMHARWGIGVLGSEGGGRLAPAPAGSPKGVVVHEVVAESPAAAAGLRAGDVITAWRGAEVKSLEELRKAEARAAPSNPVALRLARREADTWRTLEMRLEPQRRGGK